MDLQKVREQIDEHGFCVFSAGMEGMAHKAKNEYFSIKKKNKLHAQSSKFSRKSLEKQPFRKTAIGSVNGLGENISQILQSTYFGRNTPNCESLNSCAEKVVEVRNALMGMPSDFGSDPQKCGFWNASRVHQYPSGGGHMQGHSDSHFPSLLKGASHQFLQVAMSLSKRGNDFESGGFFVKNRIGRVIDIDEKSEVGSIVCFDGKLEHGILDVDSDQVLDWAANTGRMAIFSMLYQDS